MSKINVIFATFLGALLFCSSCDDGDIHEKIGSDTGEGRTVKLTGRFRGVSDWSKDYSVVLAGFGDGDYSVVQKALPTSVADGEYQELTLSGISDNVSTIELCVTNRLRERIVTLKSVDVNSGRDTIFIDMGTVNVGMLAAIQSEVFNETCAQCHGGSNEAAAGLFLTEGRSYSSLVNQMSTRVEGGVRVVPGDVENSVLHNVVSEGNKAGLHFSHENMINSDKLLNLIDNWIEAGAKE